MQYPSTTKAAYWILTIPHAMFTPFLPVGIKYAKGQLEKGEGGYLHWQLVVHTKGQQRLSWITNTFGPFHAEPTKSKEAEEYVWKEETKVDGTRFELGQKSLKRNCSSDWEEVYELARTGDFESIPADIRVRLYGNLKQIAKDNMRPEAMARKIRVYWGSTGTGKSHRAWNEAGWDAYPKIPTSIYWDGYKGQENVVFDEFRGDIGISHILRWFDRYPTTIEAKHGGTVLKAKNIWITSNLHPSAWYPSLDEATVNALLRRLEITELTVRYEGPASDSELEEVERRDL